MSYAVRLSKQTTVSVSLIVFILPKSSCPIHSPIVHCLPILSFYCKLRYIDICPFHFSLFCLRSTIIGTWVCSQLTLLWLCIWESCCKFSLAVQLHKRADCSEVCGFCLLLHHAHQMCICTIVWWIFLWKFFKQLLNPSSSEIFQIIIQIGARSWP